jgi:adenylate cyclase
MTSPETSTSGEPRGLRRGLLRVLSIADLPGDDDDARLRKRVGISAGIVTVFAALPLPSQAQPQAFVASILLALGLSTWSLINLAILARTRRFERFVFALIVTGPVFIILASVVGGGITGSTPGIVWGFLVPAYAILALGPRGATPWFVAYLVSIGVMVLIDPVVHDALGAPAYDKRLVGQVQDQLLPLIIVFLLLRYTDVRRRAAEARADELLTNAIPSVIATRLKHGEQRIAESYAETTIVFADLAGFTPWAAGRSPTEVVTLLDALFSSFDELTERRGLEKVKTIGDAYMAVAGAPVLRADHAVAAIQLARSMVEATARWRREHEVELRIRVGLASGPVVAGVIGRRRLLFDLWGETVNLAARMESSGVPDRIQVAASTRAAAGDQFQFDERDVDIKGLGRMTAYLLADEAGLAEVGRPIPVGLHASDQDGATMA